MFDGVLLANSADGSLRFELTRRPIGVVMTRMRQLGRRRCAVQHIHLVDEASLHRWCEGDQLRFCFPLLFDTLKRSGGALFCDAV